MLIKQNVLKMSSNKTELLEEHTEELPMKQTIKDAIDEDGDEVEEVTQVTRKVVKRTMKITEVSNCQVLL